MLLLAATSRAGADVQIYGEGSYNDVEVVVDLFADVTSAELKSFGIKLSYDPALVRAAAATAEDSVWYFGPGLSEYPAAEPDLDTPGEVILIGAKLDTLAPAEGVAGTRVPLGQVLFDRLDAALPDFALSLGRSGDFANFVTSAGVGLDASPGAVQFASVVLSQEADGDGDGVVNSLDNCPLVPNGPAQDGQADANANGRGDACECGDMSGDGFVNSVDARLIQRCSVGQIPCTGLCDATGEGTCNSIDARLVQRASVGLVPDLSLICAESP